MRLDFLLSATSSWLPWWHVPQWFWCFACKEMWVCAACCCAVGCWQWGWQPPTGDATWEVKSGLCLKRLASFPVSPFGVGKLRFLYQYRELLANSLWPQGTRGSVNIQVSVLFYQNSCCCFEVFSPQFLVYFSRASYIDSFYWLCLCNQSAVLSCSINLEFKVSKYCLLGVFLNTCLNELHSSRVLLSVFLVHLPTVWGPRALYNWRTGSYSQTDTGEGQLSLPFYYDQLWFFAFPSN